MTNDAYSRVWEQGRPVYLRLPRDGYQNNDDIKALLTQPDEFLTGVKTLLEGLYQQLNPLIAPEGWLDYIAWLNGWSDEYWDALWTPAIKRALIVISNRVWSGLGQLSTLELILDTHGIEHRIWASTSLQLSFTLPATFHTPKGVVYIRLPLKYVRSSYWFKEAKRSRNNFIPCVLLSDAVYEYFYLGYSNLGEPMFS